MDYLQYKNYLAHHGIKGQKWGDKNGPPYPLDYDDHSAKQKKLNPKSIIDGSTTRSSQNKHPLIKKATTSDRKPSNSEIGKNDKVSSLASHYKINYDHIQSSKSKESASKLWNGHVDKEDAYSVRLCDRLYAMTNNTRIHEQYQEPYEQILDRELFNYLSKIIPANEASSLARSFAHAPSGMTCDTKEERSRVIELEMEQMAIAEKILSSNGTASDIPHIRSLLVNYINKCKQIKRDSDNFDNVTTRDTSVETFTKNVSKRLTDTVQNMLSSVNNTVSNIKSQANDILKSGKNFIDSLFRR